MTDRKPIGAYKADETPCYGSNPLPWAAYDKSGTTWRVTEAEAHDINATKQERNG